MNFIFYKLRSTFFFYFFFLNSQVVLKKLFHVPSFFKCTFVNNILNKKNNFKNRNNESINFFFINNFFVKFFSQLFNNKVYLISSNLEYKFVSSSLRFLFSRLIIKYRFFFTKIITSGILSSEKFFSSLFLSLLTKNFESFFFLLQQLFIKIPLNKHTLLFRFINQIFSSIYFKKILDELGIKGLKFVIKGKIGVGGNARSRSTQIKINKFSSSTINNKFYKNKFILYTLTGVLGIKFSLVF